MTLSADLKAIHEAGAKFLPEIAALYREMSEDVAGVGDLHATLTRPGTSGAHWAAATSAFARIFRMAAENTGQAGDVTRMIAYAYAATDEEAAANLKKAAGIDGDLPTYIYGTWG